MCENNKCSCYTNEVKCLPSICDRYIIHCTDELTCGNLKMAEGLNSDSESDIDTA